MADTIFYMYPSGEVDFGPAGWQIDPLAVLVDEPQDAPVDLGDYAESMPVSTPVTWSTCWSMTPPAAAVVISKVTLYVRIWAVSENSTPHDLTDLKGFTQIGGTNHYTAGQTVFGTTAAQGPNPALYFLGDMATNPDTGVAWTIPELQAGIFGVEYTDLDVGSNTPRTRIGQFYVRVEAQTIAQSIEGRRTEGTHYLLAVGRQHIVFEVSAPPAFVDLEPGDLVAVSDRLGPTDEGAGWRHKPWQRREALVLENEWIAAARRCRLVLFDLRFFRVSMWWQPKTDLPYTEEGQGIPRIDSGGGYTLARASMAYVRKQSTDQLYAQVPIDFPKWTSDGLQVGGGGDVTLSLNDSFSQGTSGGVPTFTPWVKTETGTGSLTEDLADFAFDATGLRRSVIVATGLTVGSTAYLSQAHTVTGPAYGRVEILFKHDGGVQAGHWQVQRTADGWYWDDVAGAWTATSTDNPVSLAKVGALDGYYSKLIPLASGSDDYTLRVGFVTGGAVAPSQLHLYFAAFVAGARAAVDGFRSLDVTTTVATTRVRDDLQLANAEPVRWWDPWLGGQIELRIVTLFEHASMDDGEVKPLLFCQGRDANDFEVIEYLRVSSGEGRWRLHRQVSGVDYFADVVVTSSMPKLFEEHKLAARWTGPEAELDQAEGSLSMCADGVWSGWTAAELPDMGPESTAYLGWNPVDAVPGDFVLQALRARKLVLTDDETFRELGE